MIVRNREAFVCLEALLFLQGSNPTSSRDLFFSISLSPTSQIEEIFLGTNTEPSVLETQFLGNSRTTEKQKFQCECTWGQLCFHIALISWTVPTSNFKPPAYSILASSPGPTQTWSHLQTFLYVLSQHIM